MAQNGQLVRHLSILQRLDTVVGVTIPELMEITQKNRRTIERDLSELKEARFPLSSESVNGMNRWKFLKALNSAMKSIIA